MRTIQRAASCAYSPLKTKLSRLLFLIILFGVGYLLYHLYGRKLLRQSPKSWVKPALIAALVLVVLAVATGRANAIFAVFGGLIAAAWRMSPLLLRFYPQIRQLFNRINPSAAAGAGVSKVTTATLVMSLDHTTGRIDGDITAGQFKGRALSDLTFEEISQFYRVCEQQDTEALRLLQAFIQREFPEKWEQSQWRDDPQSEPASSGGISVDEAWETLGLPPGSDRESIIKAHRKLMGRLHPDKGGSTFLASRVNQAKDKLLAELIDKQGTPS